MIKSIPAKGKPLALLLDLKDIDEGTYPVSDASGALQLLMMKRKAGHVVKKHMHKRILKSTKQPQEGMVVMQGAISVTLFDRKGTKVSACTVSAGQCLLVMDGAHEVNMLKPTRMFEFKSGPYVDDKIFL
jgi:hypothetical protein